MMEDAEISYADLGKKLFVSGGTIHVRIKKLEESGIVKGKKLSIDLKALGYDVIAFIGIYLEKSSLYDSVAKELKKIPEVLECHYTTGNWSILIKIICRDNEHLMNLLNTKIQAIEGVSRTETFISLDQQIERQIQL